jgi:hypothetical protein
MLTTILGKGAQTSHTSWWPKPTTWAISAFNVGYWTKYAEDWFQKRLTSIRNNEESCRTAAQWHNTIPRRMQGLNLAKKAEEAAGMFLEGHDFA